MKKITAAEEMLLKQLAPCYENKEQMAEDIGSPTYRAILAAMEEYRSLPPVDVRMVVFIEKDKVRIQPAPYIEHGWYIDISEDKYFLFEIPYGGGESIPAGSFGTLIAAIEAGENLT